MVKNDSAKIINLWLNFALIEYFDKLPVTSLPFWVNGYHTNLLNPTLITFLFYIVAMVVIDLFSDLETTRFDDYILDGRGLGSFVTPLSAGASNMSSWLLMGLSQFIPHAPEQDVVDRFKRF